MKPAGQAERRVAFAQHRGLQFKQSTWQATGARAQTLVGGELSCPFNLV